MVPPINDPRDGQQSRSPIRPSEMDSSKIQTDNQLSSDILNSGEDNETDADSDSSSSSSSSSSSNNDLKDFSSDDTVKDPTYEDPFYENCKAQSDSDVEQLPQAQLPGIQDFLQSAVDNQELFSINSPSPRVDDQPHSVGEHPSSVGEHPSSVGEQCPSVDVELRSSCRKRKAEPLLWKRNQSKLLKNKGMSCTSMSKTKKVYDAKKWVPYV